MSRLTIGIFASFLFIATPATAVITDLGNVTRDTTSGFDWLDVTETLGLSYNEVVAGPLYDEGWRHATVPEWCNFVAGLGATSGWVIYTLEGGPFPSQCGAPPPPGTGSGAFVNFDDLSFGVDWPLLQSYLGITTPDTPQTVGVLDYGPDGDPLNRSEPYVPRGRLHDLTQVQNFDDRFQLQSQLSGVSVTTADERSMGHFLVRPIPTDSDLDGVFDDIDNCISVANPEQEDTDGDGLGDACNDAEDFDGDEYADALDNCPDDFNPGQEDSDGDLIGDLCDPFPNDPNHELAQCEADRDQCLANPPFIDADGDGEHDATDICPATPFPSAVDQAGCSLTQFCISIDASTKTGERICKSSDWLNDEAITGPKDCAVQKQGRGLPTICVPV